ncbi:MAG: ABC transporter permease [Ignavibacteria bacterium]|jgi:ABC-type antimicrobial peptide transport system permease subunit
MNSSKLPFLGKIILKNFLDSEDAYFLTGDIEEVYLEKKSKDGIIPAQTWFWYQVIKSLPPLIIDNLIWSIIMFMNYLKLAYRNILRNKVYSFINITGLSIGLTCCLIIFLFVKYELSFDSFYKNADNIYRVNMTSQSPEGIIKESCVPFPMPEAFRLDFPDVEAITHVFYDPETQLELEEDLFNQENIVFTDSSFFKVFDFEFILGNPESLFKSPDAAVLTESTANKLFGSEPPLGKTFSLNKQIDLKVAGIIKDVPSNTHLPIQMIVSLESLTEDFVGMNLENWNLMHSGSLAYILINDNEKFKSINQRLGDFRKNHYSEREAKRKKFVFQPIKDIHNDTEYSTDSLTYVTSIESIIIFSVIGILTLIIASINFINLSVAQSIKRSKEVGMRKVIGAHRIQLIKQFMGETFVYALCSFLISILLTSLLLPYAGDFLGINTRLSLFSDWTIILYLLLVFVIVNLMTGFYPSIVLSGFNPVQAFRNKITVKKSGSFSLRNNLVIFQFVISQILIVSTIVVSYQLSYVKNKDLGFRKDKIISVNMPDVELSQKKIFKNKILQNPKISNVALSGGAPISGMLINTFFSKIPMDTEERYLVTLKPIDKDYLETFNIKLLAGQNFRQHVEGDTLYKFIVNESLIKKLGFTNPVDAVGQKFQFSRVAGEIIGVTKDYHTSSLQNEIGPVAMSNMHEEFYVQTQIKVNSADEKEVIKFLESTWEELFPGYNFSYTFFEEFIDELYSVEENFFDMMKIFAVLAIVIGCLGLIGLISFVTIQKTKEIGVRKVLGASVSDILLIISKEFTLNVLLANFIAWPVTWYFMNKWLEDFAYRIDIEWWMFIAAGIASLLLTIVTVSFQSIKAATLNPVNSLKYE